MTDDRTMADFRTQVAMLRRQRWRQVEYGEDPPVALLFAEADAQNRGGRGFSSRTSARQDTWRKVWVTDAGRVMQENVDPPGDEPEEAAAQAAPENVSPPAKEPKAPPAESAQAAAKPPAARARKTPAKAAKTDTPPEPEAETAPAKPVKKPARPKKES